MKKLLLFLSMLLLVGGTTMVFANGANGSDLTRVSNNENSASTTDVVQPQNNNSGVKPLKATNNEPVITFTTSKKIGEKITLKSDVITALSEDIKIEGATLKKGSSVSYVLTAQTVKIIGPCTELICSDNRITSLDLSKNSGLIFLDCSFNELTSLDLSKNSGLTILSCDSNELTSLDLSKNNELTGLNCSFNKLTSLDLSNNSKLTSLNCYSNKLTSLNLLHNSELSLLYCESNKITQIQLPKYAKKLTLISCESNNIDVEHMEQLINRLPERTGNTTYYFYVQSSSTDGNQITLEQAQLARDKGWSVSVSKYTTTTGISTIDNADALPRKVFDLNGCEVNENQAKGVVIVKQGNKTYKKVVK